MADALRRAIEARKRIVRADVLWTQASPNDWRYTQGRPITLRSLIAGDEIGHVIFGTADGVATYQSDGAPTSRGPQAALHEREVEWRYDMNTTEADRSDGQKDIADFRSIGLSPIPLLLAPNAAVSQALPRGRHGLSYRQTQRPDGLYEVTCDADDGAAAIIWWIDPSLDWNITRSEYRLDGRPMSRCEVVYDKVNDTVVPVSAIYYDANGAITTLFQVDSLEVNDAGLPADLAPEHIGIEPGFTIYARDPSGATVELMYEGDGRCGPPQEVLPKIARGELAVSAKVVNAWADRPLSHELPDPREVRRQLDALRLASTSRPADEWENYTIHFIRTFGLDDEQRQRAWQTLRQCQAERDHRLRALRSRRDTLNAQLAAEKDQARATALRKELSDLDLPIQRIFDERLKPKLDEIPTRAQRATLTTGRSQP